MTTIDNISSAFNAIVGENNVTHTDQISERYLVDVHQKTFGSAAFLLRPENVEQVSKCVAICYQHGLPVVPYGGNTGYCSGSIAIDDNAVIISLERLNAIREIDEFNLTLTVESGAILQNIQQAAAEKNLYFPLHLGAYGSCQIGGNLSTNAGGVNVVKYGMVRQFCLGIEAVLPDGSIYKDLSLLRKNNSGYDLKQLFIGAEGTLGIITAATFMLYPEAHQRTTAFVALPSLEHCVKLVADFRRDSGDMLSSFEYFSKPTMDIVEALHNRKVFADDNYQHYALIEFSSSSKYINLEEAILSMLSAYVEKDRLLDVVIAQSEQQRLDFWELRETVPKAEKVKGKAIKHDVSMPVSKLPTFVSGFNQAIASWQKSTNSIWPYVSLYGHVGDGNFHISIIETEGCTREQMQTMSDKVYQLTAENDGSFSAEHGVGLSKMHLFAQYKPKQSVDFMKKIKAAIDDKNIMNPKKLF